MLHQGSILIAFVQHRMEYYILLNLSVTQPYLASLEWHASKLTCFAAFSVFRTNIYFAFQRIFNVIALGKKC